MNHPLLKENSDKERTAPEISLNVVNSALAGDKEALQKILVGYRQWIFREALRITRSRPDAEDVAQNISIALYRKIHQLRDPKKLTAFLRSITKNEALRYMKSKSRRLVSLDSPDLKLSSEELSPEGVADFKENPLLKISPDVLEKRLYQVLFSPPDDLKRIWSKSQSLALRDKTLAYIQEYARVLEKNAPDEWWQILLWGARPPRGSLESARRKAALKSKQSITKPLYRKRQSIIANIFLLTALSGEYDVLLPMLSALTVEGLRTGPVQKILQNRLIVQDEGPEIYEFIKSMGPEFLQSSKNIFSELLTGVNTPAEQLSLFEKAYTETEIAVLYDTERSAKEIASIGFEHIGDPARNVGAYLVERIINRGQHLTGITDWLEPWVKELGFYFEEHGECATRFAAYEGLYFAEKLGGSLWHGFSNPLSTDEAWSEAVMVAVVTEALVNLQEEWYINNPYHRAINLLRTAVYFRVCPNWRFLPQGYQRCLVNLADTYWLKWRNTSVGVRNGVLGGVNVDQVAGWIIETFCKR